MHVRIATERPFRIVFKLYSFEDEMVEKKIKIQRCSIPDESNTKVIVYHFNHDILHQYIFSLSRLFLIKNLIEYFSFNCISFIKLFITIN